MKQIQPVQIWDKGIIKTAEFLQVIGSFDDYESRARSTWMLFTKVNNEQGELISQDQLTISGADYVAWGDQPAMAINAWIYNWVASQINVVIL